MTTRREYAISLNLAQPGRGRMSRQANEAIAKAEAEGMVFTEPVAAPPKPKTPRGPVKVDPKMIKEAVAAERAKVRPTQPPVREAPEPPHKAFTGRYEVQVPDGPRKVLSDRTACTCGASFSYCYCKAPTVYRTIVDPGSRNVDEILTVERV